MILCQDARRISLSLYLPDPAVYHAFPSGKLSGTCPCQATGARGRTSGASRLRDANREEVSQRWLSVPAAKQDPDAAEECEGSWLHGVLSVRAGGIAATENAASLPWLDGPLIPETKYFRSAFLHQTESVLNRSTDSVQRDICNRDCAHSTDGGPWCKTYPCET